MLTNEDDELGNNKMSHGLSVEEHKVISIIVARKNRRHFFSAQINHAMATVYSSILHPLLDLDWIPLGGR